MAAGRSDRLLQASYRTCQRKAFGVRRDRDPDSRAADIFVLTKSLLFAKHSLAPDRPLQVHGSAVRLSKVREQRLARYVAKPRSAWQGMTRLANKSREAAQEYSPGRQPWDEAENKQALKGRKIGCDTDSPASAVLTNKHLTNSRLARDTRGQAPNYAAPSKR